MISAMYENGGNTTQRFLDGHPQLFVYPYESQVGTRAVQDYLSALYPAKYRWPEFLLSATPADDYQSIIDEEVKVRARTPNVSKFRDYPFDFSDDFRRQRFIELMASTTRSRASLITAFFIATFEAWKDYARSGHEVGYVGYSPIIVVDAEKILRDLPLAHVLHIVRNPWSAYSDTLKRPVPLSLSHYMRAWAVCQEAAIAACAVAPDRMHVIRFEDLIENPATVLGEICKEMSLDIAPSLAYISWNGQQLGEVYPWGTIRTPTPEANRATARELSHDQAREIRRLAGHLLTLFDYEEFGQDL
jgi:hypothetical protein